MRQALYLLISLIYMGIMTLYFPVKCDFPPDVFQYVFTAIMVVYAFILRFAEKKDIILIMVTLNSMPMLISFVVFSILMMDEGLRIKIENCFA